MRNHTPEQLADLIRASEPYRLFVRRGKGSASSAMNDSLLDVHADWQYKRQQACGCRICHRQRKRRDDEDAAEDHQMADEWTGGFDDQIGGGECGVDFGYDETIGMTG